MYSNKTAEHIHILQSKYLYKNTQIIPANLYFFILIILINDIFLQIRSSKLKKCHANIPGNIKPDVGFTLTPGIYLSKTVLNAISRMNATVELFLFHIVEDVLNIFIFLEFLKEFIELLTLLSRNLFVIGRNTLKLGRDNLKSFILKETLKI